MNAKEILDLDVESIMNQEFYCHKCLENGEQRELTTVYYTEDTRSFKPDLDKYIAIAEKGCPEPEHTGVEFQIRESFYSDTS